MPNWIKNSVNVCVPKGVDKERLSEFQELVGDDFSFERIAPMPETLIPKWYENLTQEEIANINSTTNGQNVLDRFSLIELEKIPWNYVPEWYTWRLENWGCKWDSSEVTFIYDHNDFAPRGLGEVMLECFFNTPWSPPEAICAKLRHDFPDLLIQWIWYDMDDFQGCFTL